MRVVLDVTYIGDVATELIEADLVYEVSSHGVKEIGILINNILVIEEKFVRLEQLLLLHHELICVFIILHYLVILHVVIRDGLSSKHNECILVYHVETHKPYATVDDGVKNNPRVPLDVQLLDGGPVSPCFIANGVDISMAKCAAVGSPHRLLKAWKSFLVHGAYFEVLTLLKILAFQGAANDVHKVLELGYSKIDSIVHHFAESFECFCWNIK